MSVKTKIILAICAVLLVAAGVTVKLMCFPAIKDSYFATNNQNMKVVPSGLVVVRPTHFPKSARRGVFNTTVQIGGKNVWRMTGRGVTFKALIAAAWGQNQDRVELPWDAPKTNFDFLVTVADKPRVHLQDAIRKKLGFVAEVEMRTADVLALKVVDTNLPGLTVSAPGETQDASFNNGKVEFTHMRFGDLAPGFEQVIKTPIVDKTGLTNYYDFAMDWNMPLQRQLQSGTNGAALVKGILRTWGLGLEPDTASVKTLVVKRAG
jgi:uncharacterized protein (TIGR03435 family)